VSDRGLPAWKGHAVLGRIRGNAGGRDGLRDELPVLPTEPPAELLKGIACRTLLVRQVLERLSPTTKIPVPAAAREVRSSRFHASASVRACLLRFRGKPAFAAISGVFLAAFRSLKAYSVSGALSVRLSLAAKIPFPPAKSETVQICERGLIGKRDERSRPPGGQAASAPRAGPLAMDKDAGSPGVRMSRAINLCRR
jgi:hypothetical protein